MPPYKGQDKNKSGPCKFKIFDSFDLTLLKRDIFIIVILSILTKLVLGLLRYYVFYTYFDLFDTTIYFNYAVNVLHGMVPYVDFSVEYP